MSFILDALRRADAQRERDPSRGIHAQGGPLHGGSERSLRSRAALPWVGLALLLVLLAGLAWWLASRTARLPQPLSPLSSNLVAEPVAPRAANAISPPPPVILVSDGGYAAGRERPGSAGYRGAAAPGQLNAPAASAQAVPQAAPQPPAQVAPVPQPQPQPVPQATQTLPAVPQAPLQQPQPQASQQPSRNQPIRPGQGPGPAQAPAPAPAASAAPAPVPSPLPPDAPKLAISGGVYSSNVARRMVIVNGQVVHEGAEPVPGVVVEEIQPNAAVLRYRGQRYTANY